MLAPSPSAAPARTRPGRPNLLLMGDPAFSAELRLGAGHARPPRHASPPGCQPRLRGDEADAFGRAADIGHHRRKMQIREANGGATTEPRRGAEQACELRQT